MIPLAGVGRVAARTVLRPCIHYGAFQAGEGVLMSRLLACLGILLVATTARALMADWPQFRGPEGAPAAHRTDVPHRWGPGQNVLWKVALPGPGSSSPIVVGQRVFVTCYSGYGIDADNPGDLKNLKRHLLCVEAGDGRLLWEKSIPAALPEQPFEGFVTLHGYASSTPASDGQSVYVFFGRSGVYAFTLDGDLRWHTEVGTGTHAWGTAASPILWNDRVVVNASVESGSLVALDRKSGKPLWRVSGIRDSWSTPAVVQAAGRSELVVSSRGKVQAFDPASGELLWHCSGVQDYVCPAVIADDGLVFVTGGRKPHTLAIRAGGQGDVSKTHILWEAQETPKVATPLQFGGHLYWVDQRGVATCLDAKTGKTVYKERLSLRGRGDKVYASPVAVGGALLVPSREDGTIVLALEPRFNELGRNRLDDSSIVNATPAVCGNRLLVRTDRFLYCIGK